MPRKTPQKWQLATALDPTIIRIIPELAVEIGLNESIVLMQISFWIGQSNNLKDNTYWTFQSLRDMQKKAFPYWSIATIRRTVQNLADKGYILIGNYNSRKGDNTQWFALVPDKCSTLTSVLTVSVDPKKGTSVEGESLQNETGLFQNDTPPLQNETALPEITTETPTENLKNVISLQKPKRQPDLIYNAVSSVWDTTASGVIVHIKSMLLGAAKSGDWADANFDTPATPDEIYGFGQWWKRKHSDLTLPQKPDKIQRWFYEYRRTTTKNVIALDPALDLSIQHPVTPMLLDRAVGGDE